MKKRCSIFLLIGLAYTAVFVSCGTSAQVLQKDVSASVRLKIIDSGANSSTGEKELSFYVLYGKEKFDDFFRKVHSSEIPSPSVPPVDFEKEIAVACILGQKPTAGYSIGFVEDAVLSGGILTVHVYLKKPMPGSMLAQVFTNPFMIASVPGTGIRTIKFVDDEGTVLKQIDDTDTSARGGG